MPQWLLVEVMEELGQWVLLRVGLPVLLGDTLEELDWDKLPLPLGEAVGEPETLMERVTEADGVVEVHLLLTSELDVRAVAVLEKEISDVGVCPEQ